MAPAPPPAATKRPPDPRDWSFAEADSQNGSSGWRCRVRQTMIANRLSPYPSGFLLVLAFLQRSLKFLKPFFGVLRPPGHFLKRFHPLQFFPPFGLLRPLSLLLGLITVLRLGEVHILELHL